ncbi:hypothetical protein [Salinisphaera hydrothermalis]|uniref:Uncharacterized protein n=1 Tax=Salinisphaera hydrothermalis (strain C41B8) TaxID=1304275 RepID=A0A084IP14_SALHC|nr:hypothetical protein [Salinisphaera hydrothermalis]KEZ78448.1 hypothetical protein C41B8_04431 [Salinisphaera hydrothermalis C41B8]
MPHEPRNESRVPALRWSMLAMTAAFLVPPLAGLAMIAHFFGGMSAGLWWLAGGVFLFAVVLIVGFARLARAPAGRPR